MSTIDLVIEGKISKSVRARQVSSMFDVPAQEKCRLEWHIEAPFDDEPWNVGLIVGPSGAGKTRIAEHLFGPPLVMKWGSPSVIDDFSKKLSVEQIAAVCQAVGFNTIPAWLRPYEVLSNGEKFRVDIARRLLEEGDPIVVDEFTSVVDRQVAKIGSHAVQKHVRKNGRKFIAVTCHYDVVDWLQPDWVLDLATRSFSRRLLQRRPEVRCVVGRVPHSTWDVFSRFHYLTGELHRAVRCYALWADGELAAFAGVIHRPHPRARGIWGVSRLVTLPDYQGLGLAMALVEKLGAAHKQRALRLRTYPAHPALIRAFDRAKEWSLVKAPGMSSSTRKSERADDGTGIGTGVMGGRPCAVFEYAGPAASKTDADLVMGPVTA